MAFDLVFIALRLGIGFWLLARLAPVPSKAGGTGRSPCTVVVPARNEAGQLPHTLPPLVAQLHDGDELIVVDDHSTDATAAVARDAGAQVVDAPDLTDGWTGKCSACWAGAGRASRRVLVFVDADTTLAEGTLDRVVAAVDDGGGMVSVQPYHRVPHAVERLSAFFNVVALMSTDAFTPLGRRIGSRGAFGPVLAVRTDDYRRLGGHRAVANEVVEDIALAAAWRADGLPVACFAGRDTVSYRMYPGGFRPLLEGWTKNLASGAAAVRTVTAVAVVLWISLFLQAGWWLGELAVTGGGWTSAAWTVGLYAVAAAQLFWALRRVGSFGPLTAALYPVPLVFFLFVFGRSAAQTLRGAPVRWKGRDVATRAGRPAP